MVTFLVTLNNAEARKPLSLQCFFDLYFGFNSRHQLFFYALINKNQPSFYWMAGFPLS